MARTRAPFPLVDPIADRLVEVLNLQTSVCASTHAAEDAECLLDDGRVLHVHVKRALPGHLGWGHKGGIGREVWMYRHALDPARDGTPRLVGWDDTRGREVLVIEHVPDALRLTDVEVAPVLEAARWLGRFHTSVPRAADTLPLLGEHYLAGVVGQAVHELLGHPCEPGLADRLRVLARDPTGLVHPLASGSPVVVHGEFYPHNLLWSGGRVHVIDWESAALGAGELDLAALVEGWSPRAVEDLVEAYVHGRSEVPVTKEAVGRRLTAASVFWCLRWLTATAPGNTSRRQRQRVRAWMTRLDARLDAVLP